MPQEISIEYLELLRLMPDFESRQKQLREIEEIAATKRRFV